MLDVLRRSPGQTSFTISVVTSDDRKVTLRPASRFKVALTPVLVKEWERVCGKNTLKIEFPALDALTQQRGGFRRKFTPAK